MCVGSQWVQGNVEKVQLERQARTRSGVPEVHGKVLLILRVYRNPVDSNMGGTLICLHFSKKKCFSFAVSNSLLGS